MKTWTLGGKQFWTDHAWRAGWKIQANALTGRWRLIDDRNYCYVSGSRQNCESALEAHIPKSSPVDKPIVVLLHGLIRTSRSMRSLGLFLESHMACQSVTLEYASTCRLIPDHASALFEVVSQFPDDTPIHFVGHSMGNIVVRHLLGDLERSGNRALADRIRSIVMLGPPNQGSSFARMLSRVGILPLVTGRGGWLLGPGWPQLEPYLATPRCPFGIVAGSISNSLLSNPIIQRPSDFVVTVEETRLEGASDTLEVPWLHSFLMNSRDVQEATLRFFQTSRFK